MVGTVPNHPTTVPHLPIGSPLLGEVTTVIIMDKHYSSFPSMYHNACNISISSYEALLEIYSLTGGQRVYPRLSKWVSSLIGKWVGTPEYVLPTDGQVGCGCGNGGLLDPELYPLMGKGSLFLFMHRSKWVGEPA